jgi:predicted acyl esterase
VVKLIDVYPDNAPDPEGMTSGNKRILDTPPLHMSGYQEMLRGEPFRAKFRNNWENPEALTPGKETDISFSMPDLYHTFRAGHRIMVQVQSSWFPLTDRNPQTFTDIPYAKPEEFQKATERVYRQKDAPSGVEVLVMP